MHRHVETSLGARSADRLAGPDAAPVSDRRRLLALLLLHSTITQVITFVLRPTSAYRAIELGVSPAWLGALTASFAVVPLVLAVPSGQATDRFGERRVMLVGAVLMTLSGVVFALERGGAAGLVLGSVVLGTGHLLSVVGPAGRRREHGRTRAVSTAPSATTRSPPRWGRRSARR